MKIQNDNSKKATKSPDIMDFSALTKQKSSPLPLSPKGFAQSGRNSGNFNCGCTDMRYTEPGDDGNHKNNEGFFKHFLTTVDEDKPLGSPSRKFPKPLSPASDIDDEYDSKSKGWNRDNVFIQRIQKSPNGSFLDISLEQSDYKSLFKSESKNKKFFENLYKAENQEKESLLRRVAALQSEMDIEKKSSDVKSSRLLSEIKILKGKNLQLESDLRKLSKTKEKGPLIKKSCIKVNEHQLEMMDKIELLDNIYSLKAEHEVLSQKLLDQADELFEKNHEIKQLQGQKSALYKELNNLQKQNEELSGTREHVATLINIIRELKDRLHKIAELYKGSRANLEIETERESDEILSSIYRLSDIVDNNLLSISQKKKKELGLIRTFGGSQLVYHLKEKIGNMITNYN